MEYLRCEKFEFPRKRATGNRWRFIVHNCPTLTKLDLAHSSLKLSHSDTYLHVAAIQNSFGISTDRSVIRISL